MTRDTHFQSSLQPRADIRSVGANQTSGHEELQQAKPWTILSDQLLLTSQPDNIIQDGGSNPSSPVGGIFHVLHGSTGAKVHQLYQFILIAFLLEQATYCLSTIYHCRDPIWSSFVCFTDTSFNYSTLLRPNMVQFMFH